MSPRAHTSSAVHLHRGALCYPAVWILSVPSSELPPLAPSIRQLLRPQLLVGWFGRKFVYLYEKRRVHAQQAWQPAGGLWIPRTGPIPRVVRPEHAHRERRGGRDCRPYKARILMMIQGNDVFSPSASCTLATTKD